MALFGSASTASTTSANPTQGDISKDVPVSAGNGGPSDSISQVAFSPTADILAASSWDGGVYTWQINAQGQSNAGPALKFDAPALACTFMPDGSGVIGAACDKTAKKLDLGSSQTVQVAAHDQPIKCAKMANVNGTPILVTGSWDKTIKYWDLRASNSTPVGSVTCQERVYTMDVRDKLLVVGTADRYIDIISLDNPNQFYKTMQSPLKWQTRVVSCFTDASGFAVGSIEGRCAINYVEEKDTSSNFSFKCHRVTESASRDICKVYSVNDISFHPVHGTFSTAGSDGTFHFWDKDAKHRLKGYPEVGGPITSTAFNSSGTIFAYAISYDWSKGYAHNNQNIPQKIMLHPVQPDECKPRAGGKNKR